jgi:hypothetical protein
MDVGYWLINTAGIGGLIVVTVFLILTIVYARLVRWILDGGAAEAENDARE